MSDTPLKRFFLWATILLIAGVALSQLLFTTVLINSRFPCRMASMVWIWGVTCASHYWVMTTVTENPKAFNKVFLIQTTVKLLLYLVCILIYLMLYRQQGLPFTVHFLITYLIFASFEVFSILKFINSNHARS